jgi:hypothetical protein
MLQDASSLPPDASNRSDRYSHKGQFFDDTQNIPHRRRCTCSLRSPTCNTLVPGHVEHLRIHPLSRPKENLRNHAEGLHWVQL